MILLGNYDPLIIWSYGLMIPLHCSIYSLLQAQCKNAVLEAEMAKLKAKIIVLENTEGQKRQYEKKCEEMAARLLDMEKKVASARKEINHYQV